MERVMELRWDPILQEWVMVSNIREERPWRPEGFCPFCPGMSETGYGWDVVLVENKYPMLTPRPPNKGVSKWPYIKAPAYGRCLILVETPKHDLDDISDLGLRDIVKVIKKVIDVVLDAERSNFNYVLWFRNKGKEVGVSLTHPHSQIYVLPFIPSKIARELKSSREWFRVRGSCLFCSIISEEIKAKIRVVYKNNYFIAFIPFWAHWPFEVHIYSLRHVSKISELNENEIYFLSDALKKVLQGLKKVFNKPMPYVMVMHQSPLRGDYPYYHLHIEIYGMYRVSGRLKYAAGMELGGGNFTYDATPEHIASILRDAIGKVSVNDK